MTDFKPGDKVRRSSWITDDGPYDDGSVVTVEKVHSRGNESMLLTFEPVPSLDDGMRYQRQASYYELVQSVSDPVNSPAHYTEAVPGIEVIDVTEHFNFNRGNALKYVMRAGKKGDKTAELQDLNKAAWYIKREIGRLEAAS